MEEESACLEIKQVDAGCKTTPAKITDGRNVSGQRIPSGACLV